MLKKAKLQWTVARSAQDKGAGFTNFEMFFFEMSFLEYSVLD